MRLRLHKLSKSLSLVIILAIFAACSPATALPAATTEAQATTRFAPPPVQDTPASAPTVSRTTSDQPAVPTETQPATLEAPTEGTQPTPAVPATAGPTDIETSPTGEPVQSTDPAPSNSQLAFLKEGDIWLLDDPAGQAYQLTFAGDIISYAWSPDGERLAAFNGRSLCFFHRDGSVRTACLELGLNDEQAEIERRILWSPDQRWIVLWNPENPQDEEAIGWLIVALDTSGAMWRIQDPVDWGAELAPNNEAGGFTGQPIFLNDARLLGTLSHRYLCGSGGCRYQLYQLDLTGMTPSFKPYPNKPEDGWSEGRNLILSSDGQILTNYGAFLFDCDSYQTFVDRFNLETDMRDSYSLDNVAADSLAFTPDEGAAVLARIAGCSPADTEAWSRTCGLSSGPEVLPIQHWEPAGGATRDLPPGLSPAWSIDGQWLAFRSCLAQNEGGGWEADAGAPASIYLVDSAGNITLISGGAAPTWRPE